MVDPEREPPRPVKLLANPFAPAWEVARQLPGQTWRLFAVGAVAWFGQAIYWFVVILYIVELGLGESAYGILMLVSSGATILTILYIRRITEAIGLRNTIIISRVLMVAAFTVYILGSNVWQLAPAAFLFGTGQGLMNPAKNSLLAQKSTSKLRDWVFSLDSFGGMAVGLVASVIAGAIPDYTRTVLGSGLLGYRIMFGLGIVAALIAMIMALGLTERPETTAKHTRLKKGDKRLIFQVSVPGMILGFGAGILVPFLLLWFREVHGARDLLLGIILATGTLLMMVFLLIIPVISSRLRQIPTIVGFEGTATLLLIMLPFMPWLWLAAGLAILRAAFMNSTHPISNSFLMSKVSFGARPFASGFKQISWLGSQSLGVFTGAMILENGGMTLVSSPFDLNFLVCIVTYVVAIGLFTWFFRKEFKDIGLPGWMIHPGEMLRGR